MFPVQSQDLEGLVKLNSILILDVDWWGASYLRNIVAHGSAHITTKQGNKILPPELWLDIIDRVESYVDGNTYKPVYGVKLTPGSMDASGTESALVCNVLEEWTKCGDLTGGNRVNAYEKCLHDPFYKLDPEKDETDENEKYYFIITKTVEKNSYSIPVSHLRLKGDFLFRNIEVPDIIARLEDGDCHLCWGQRSLDINRADNCEDASFFCGGVLCHRWCYHETICGLCIGGDYASDHLDIMFAKCEGAHSDDEEEEEDTEEEKMEKKNFRKRLKRRFQELGYEWWGC
ncbi:hypothetical protein FANTH_3566 [Fusarium anthophilum]|uniref:Uncharacterized protein n=1 Tax=Fusarium anthophilum TaxID=48485 RepID=A0A8H4ZRC8_9HYPO|nr:hypothetical protein FANTH_3566 [Fusarium anthophilum]